MPKVRKFESVELKDYALVAEAIRTAEFIHRKDKRRGGKKYFTHLEATANLVQHIGGTPELIAVAYLHDILEMHSDTISTAQLHHLFGEEVLEGVLHLTHLAGTSYEKYISNIPDKWKLVKLSDIVHNLSDKPTEEQIGKYARGLAVLGRIIK